MHRDTAQRATALLATVLLASNALVVAVCVAVPASRGIALVSLPFLLVAQLGSLCALSCARHLARHGHPFWSWLGIAASVAGTAVFLHFLGDPQTIWSASHMVAHWLLCLAGAIACALQLAEVKRGTPRRILRVITPIVASFLCLWVALLSVAAVAGCAWLWQSAALLALAGFTCAGIDAALGAFSIGVEPEATRGDREHH